MEREQHVSTAEVHKMLGGSVIFLGTHTLLPLPVLFDAGIDARTRLLHQLLVDQQRRLQRQSVLAQQLEPLIQWIRQRSP